MKKNRLREYEVKLQELLRSKPPEGRVKGVYKITNTVNGKFYIGSSNNIYVRFSVHLLQLKYRKHHNSRLAIDYKNYSPDVFNLEILERCVGVSREEIYHLEQKWIDSLNPYYNIQLIVQIPPKKPVIKSGIINGRKVKILPCFERPPKPYKTFKEERILKKINKKKFFKPFNKPKKKAKPDPLREFNEERRKRLK